MRILTQDSLHALYLGVLKMFAMLGVWLCIESGIYDTAVGTSEETLHVAVLLLKTALKRFYRKHFRETGKQLTQVSDVTVKMVGSRNDPKLKTKGAESWGILLFVCKMCFALMAPRSAVIATSLESVLPSIYRHATSLSRCAHLWTLVPLTSLMRNAIAF